MVESSLTLGVNNILMSFESKLNLSSWNISMMVLYLATVNRNTWKIQKKPKEKNREII